MCQVLSLSCLEGMADGGSSSRACHDCLGDGGQKELLALPAGEAYSVCLEGEFGRGHLQPLHGCEPSRVEGANLTHEIVTSHLKVLLAVGETRAMEKMGEEIREAARSFVSSPKHN